MKTSLRGRPLRQPQHRRAAKHLSTGSGCSRACGANRPIANARPTCAPAARMCAAASDQPRITSVRPTRPRCRERFNSKLATLPFPLSPVVGVVLYDVWPADHRCQRPHGREKWRPWPPDRNRGRASIICRCTAIPIVSQGSATLPATTTKARCRNSNSSRRVSPAGAPPPSWARSTCVAMDLEDDPSPP